MTKEQEKQLDKLLVMFHLDDTLYDNEEYHRRKKAIFTLVDRFVKAGRVQPDVSNVKSDHKCAGCDTIIYYQSYCDNCRRLWES